MIRKVKTGAQLLAASVLLLAAHHVALNAGIGWGSYFLALPPLLIIMITAIARAHDVKSVDIRSFIRKMGMLLAAAAAVSLIAAPILGYTASFPTWRSVLMWWGIALAWLTTPNMPPWWKYVSGSYKIKEDEEA